MIVTGDLNKVGAATAAREGGSKFAATSRIALLHHNAYLTELQVVRENPCSLVHTAEVHSPTDGPSQVFIKAFPSKFEATGLANEIAGYLLACAAGLPVASSACLLLLRTEQLNSVHPDHIASLQNDTGLSLVWATRALPGPPLRILHPINEPEFQKRLKKWPLLPSVLAFDDLVANEDRTNDNLVAISNGEFALVDHADIAGGISRLGQFPDPHSSSKNQLLSSVYGTVVPHSVSSGMLLAAESHVAIFGAAKPEIEYWFKLLFNDQTDAQSMLAFLSARAQLSASRVRTQQGLLI